MSIAIIVERRRGRDRMVVEYMPVTTKGESSNPVHGNLYSIQQYVSDLRSVGGFLQVLRYSPPNKLTMHHDVT